MHNKTLVSTQTPHVYPVEFAMRLLRIYGIPLAPNRYNNNNVADKRRAPVTVALEHNQANN